MKKQLIVGLLCPLFFYTGFLGFFESKEEKAIKSLIDLYYSTPTNALNKISLNIYPTDIQKSFKDLIKAQNKLSNCSGVFSTALDIFHIFYSAFAEGEPVDTPLSDTCRENETNNLNMAFGNFKIVCNKYGVKDSYFNEAAKKYRR